MVLPTMLYGLSDETQLLLLNTLSDISRKIGTPTRIQLSTNDTNEIMAELYNEKNLSLIVLGIDSIKTDKNLLSIRLGKLAMQLNRDHYIVYIIKESNEVSQLLPLCARCAGMLICPATEKSIRLVFTPLLEDYARLYSNDTSDCGRIINLKTEGKIHRIRTNDIYMVQAVNKTIEFCTAKQSYASFDSDD